MSRRIPSDEELSSPSALPRGSPSTPPTLPPSTNSLSTATSVLQSIVPALESMSAQSSGPRSVLVPCRHPFPANPSVNVPCKPSAGPSYDRSVSHQPCRADHRISITDKITFLYVQGCAFVRCNSWADSSFYSSSSGPCPSAVPFQIPHQISHKDKHAITKFFTFYSASYPPTAAPTSVPSSGPTGGQTFNPKKTSPTP